jgi:hypothetical protein
LFKIVASGPAHAVDDINSIGPYATLFVPILRSSGIVKDFKRWWLRRKLKYFRTRKQVNYIISGTGQSDIIGQKNLLKNAFGSDLKEPERFLRLSQYSTTL